MDKKYVLIEGRFLVNGTSPDGDSVRFRANSKELWSRLDGPPVRLTKDGGAQLRFEGIDALETHYRAGRTVSQPKELAFAAADLVLDQIGIRDVVWTPSRKKISSVGVDETPGYILAKMTERYRRPIAFVFSGSPRGRTSDGSIVELSVSDLKKSVNYQLMLQGLVYPTYYKTLHWELRDALTAAARASRRRKKGVWQNDATRNLKLTRPETITEDVPILPKLFRRLMRMYANTGSFANLNEYLLTRRESVVQISHCHFTHFDRICTQKGNIISIPEPVEDFVFTS